jgi:hypothetical protein
MRTIIPFPKLHALDGDSSTRRGHPVPAEFPSPQALAGGQVGLDLPEGESTNAAIDESLKARALHEEIVGLIRAVRSRFG